MKYNRVILISIDSLGKKYQQFFEPYFTTVYLNYQTTSTWTLPSHLTMLSGIKFPSLYFPKKTRNHLSYEGFVQNVPTIATLLRQAGYHTRAITGGGFMSRFFGWGHDWDIWKEAYEEKDTWNGEKIMPKKREFLFLHTYYIHNWFIKNKKTNRQFEKIKRLLEDGVKVNKIEYIKFVAAAQKEYEKRVRTLSGRLSWIKRLPKDVLVVLTSDHAELFSKQGSFHHGGLALNNQDIFKVPFLVKEDVDKKIYHKEHQFDFLLTKLIFDKLETSYESIPTRLVNENAEMRKELDKIYHSKIWKLLYTYKRFLEYTYVPAAITINKVFVFNQKISIRKILKLLHIS